PGPAAAVELLLSGLPPATVPLLLQHYRIDQEHSNAFETWRRMGSPQKPTARQYAELQNSGQLTLLPLPEWLRAKEGKLVLRTSLPRQAISLLIFAWEPPRK